jgi:hypothetical protein
MTEQSDEKRLWLYLGIYVVAECREEARARIAAAYGSLDALWENRTEGGYKPRTWSTRSAPNHSYQRRGFSMSEDAWLDACVRMSKEETPIFDPAYVPMAKEARDA